MKAVAARTLALGGVVLVLASACSGILGIGDITPPADGGTESGPNPADAAGDHAAEDSAARDGSVPVDGAGGNDAPVATDAPSTRDAADGGALDAGTDAPHPPACDLSAPFGAAQSLGTVNTSSNEFLPRVSPDELSVYFGSDRPGGQGGYDVYVATRASISATFGSVAAVGGVNTSSDDSSAAISADQLTIFFESPRSGTDHVYSATRGSTSQSFSNVGPVTGIEQAGSLDAQPFLRADGNELWFISDHNASGGANYIWHASGSGVSFGSPVAATELNTYQSGLPSLSTDGLTIYFTTARPSGAGKGDIWTASRSSVSDAFTNIRSVWELNTSADEEMGSLSPDGCRIYFSSDRGGGAGGIDMYVAERPASVATPPSCAPGGAGMTNCGSAHESCCTSIETPGGTYSRTYTYAADGGGPSGEADPANVSAFQLDKYTVTVGRFRQFVKAVLPPDGGVGWMPTPGSGKHVHLNGGNGVVNSADADAGMVYESGWVSSYDSLVAPTDVNLQTTSFNPGGPCAWTPSAGANENLPMNCVTWQEAYAFCIWDGGFVPTEAEWAWVAAGGTEQREYAWGETPPGTVNQYAIYSCYYPSSAGSCTGLGAVANIAPVGSAPQGAGRWGHLDLIGDMWQFTYDFWPQGSNLPYNSCTDCMYQVAGATTRYVFRGGDWGGAITPSYGRNGDWPERSASVGVRCARTP